MLRGLLLSLLLTVTALAQTPPASLPSAEWTETTPEAAGWDTTRTNEALRYARDNGATAVMFIQHGQIVAKDGNLSERTELHSCRKSFLSALIGNAVARGQMHLDATLADLGIDDNPPSLTAAEKQATVRDLLEARSGVYHGAAYETNGMAAKRPERGSHAPGTFWYYNNWDFNALGAIYEQATHQNIYKALFDEIATPIGMQDFRAKDGTYIRDPVSRFPAYTFRMSARDFARFALLYLHHGDWNGKQVIPADWVEASTQPHSDTESGGYGYLWWTGSPATSGFQPEYRFPPGSFWLEGHLGQYAVVVPSRDLIVVVRVGSERPEKKIAKRQASHLVAMVYAAAAH